MSTSFVDLMKYASSNMNEMPNYFGKALRKMFIDYKIVNQDVFMTAIALHDMHYGNLT